MKNLSDYLDLEMTFGLKIRRFHVDPEHFERGLRKGLIFVNLFSQKGGPQLKRMT